MSGADAPRRRRASHAGVGARAGRRQARPDPRRRRRPAPLRRPHRRRRRAPRGPAGRHHGAHRAQRRRQDHLLQPAHRLRPARRRARGRSTARTWPGVAAHQVARLGMVRTFQLTKSLARLSVLENMQARRHRPDAASGSSPASSGRCGGARRREVEARAEDLLARFKLDHMRDEFAGSLSGGQRKLLEMARALMVQPRDGDARRADGRREPGPHAVAARAREGPARRRHDA